MKEREQTNEAGDGLSKDVHLSKREAQSLVDDLTPGEVVALYELLKALEQNHEPCLRLRQGVC